MEVSAVCMICGKAAMPAHSCRLCGAVVCSEHFNKEHGVCSNCAAKFRK